MLVEDLRLTAHNAGATLVHWTAPWPDAACWAFVNGEHVRGPLTANELERSTRVPLAIGQVAAIEVHAFPDTTIRPDAINAVPNARPILRWNAVHEALRYRIYHRERGGADRRVYDKPAQADTQFYEVRCPIALDGRGGRWHFLRVEGVDIYGNESTRLAWSYRSLAPPDPPTGLTIEPGANAGTYTFRLET